MCRYPSDQLTWLLLCILTSYGKEIIYIEGQQMVDLHSCSFLFLSRPNVILQEVRLELAMFSFIHRVGDVFFIHRVGDVESQGKDRRRERERGGKGMT